MNFTILLHLLCLSLTSAYQWYPLGNWIEEEGTPDLAGTAVANSLDGNIIAVTAPHYRPEEGPGSAGKRLGRVVVYKFDDTRDAWDKEGKPLIGLDGESFGSSLGMSEDGRSIIVGSIAKNENGHEKAGKVQVFVLDTATGEPEWIQKGQTLYGANAHDLFGFDVDIRDGGEVIAIGAPGQDVGTLEEAGTVSIYKWISADGKWTIVKHVENNTRDVLEGTEARGHFGASVSLSQVGVLAVGEPDANDGGKVSMIRYNATDATWVQYGLIEKPVGFELKPGDKFGHSVSVSFDGSKVAIGTPLHTQNQNSGKKHAGAITVHKHDSVNNVWAPMGGAIYGREAGDQAGFSVHLSDSGEQLAFGSPFSGLNGQESGHISVYIYSSSNEFDWGIMDAEIDGKSSFNNLGMSVAISGNGEQVMGGAPTEGYATVYMLAETAPPTMAPTPGPKSHSKVHPLRVIFSILVLSLLVFGVYKAIQFLVRKRQTSSFQAAPPSDLEMTPHGDASPAPPSPIAANGISLVNGVSPPQSPLPEEESREIL